MFTTEEINKAKELAYENWDKALNDECSIGFEFNGQWITNPFVDSSGRFELVNYEVMCKYYGTENVENFIRIILESMPKLIKTIKIPMENYTETAKLWKHEDYYSLSYEVADCSISGTLEEMKEELCKNFKISI